MVSITPILLAAIPLGLTLTLLFPVFMMDWIALIPVHIGLVKFRPWTLVTQVVAESNPFAALLNLAIVAILGPKVEGERNQITVCIALAVAVAASSLTFIVQGVVEYTFGVHALWQCVYGAVPVSLAITLLAWQQDPSAVVNNLVPIGWIPAGVLTCSMLSDIIFHQQPPNEMELGSGIPFPAGSFITNTASLVAAWAYLRFFEHRTDVAGDPSPQFAFHMMFPMPLRVAVLAISTFLTPLGKCLGFKVTLSAPTQPSTGGPQHDESDRIMVVTKSDTTINPLPDSSLAQADKRRQIALAALQSRLNEAQQQKDDESAEDDDLDFRTEVA